MFAFDSKSGQFLTSQEFIGYADIRKFTTDLKYSMYVGLSAGQLNGGDVFRYIGNINSPIEFLKIGHLPTDPSELTFYKDRLLVCTWPLSGDYRNLTNVSALIPGSLFLSPDPIDSMDYVSSWSKLWTIGDYDPDPVVALGVGASVATVIGEWAYWGTCQPTAIGELALTYVYGPPLDEADYFARLIGGHRATTFWRGKDLETKNPIIELLYGEINYPVYIKGGNWTTKPNLLNAIPQFGRSGFGNIFNDYLWSSSYYKGYLLIGTYDASLVWADIFNITNITQQMYEFYNSDLDGWLYPEYGGDLFVFNFTNNTIQPGEYISLSALDNFIAYGIRNIKTSPENLYDDVYIGTANPFNIAPNNTGGWELYQFRI